MRGVNTLLAAIILALSFGCAREAPKLDTPPPENAVRSEVNDISPEDAVTRTEKAYAQFVDVRTPAEYADGHAARAINIPLDELPGKLDRLERNEPVYVICRTGRRSREASDILVKNGYAWVFNVSGGMDAWTAAGLPTEIPRK